MSTKASVKNSVVEYLATGFGIARGVHFHALNRMMEFFVKHASPRGLVATPTTPDAERLLLERALQALRRDARNIAQGVYPMTVLKPEDPRTYFKRLPKVIADASRIHWRRLLKQNKEFSDEASALAETSPEYLRRNYHFQTDGYFSETSADFYDTQVEVLFSGTAGAMRRLALEAIVK